MASPRDTLVTHAAPGVQRRSGRASLRAEPVEAQLEALGVGAFLDTVLTATPDDMYVVDLASGDLVYASTAHRFVGGATGPRHGFAATVLGDLVSEEDAAQLSRAAEQVAELDDGAVVELRHRRRDVDGRSTWLGHRLTPFRRDEHGVVVEALAVVRDITAWVEAEDRAREADRVRHVAESRFQNVFDQAGIGAVIVGLDGIPTHVNAAACALLGRPAELLVGRRWSEYNHADNMSLTKTVEDQLALGSDTSGDERRYLRPDGSVVWASTHLTLVRDDEGQPEYVLAQLADITERRRMQDELEHLALHDSLTGLPNRSLFVERVRQAVLDASAEPVAVVVLLVAGLHTVIERDGYAVGDLVLTEVAGRLTAALGDRVTIAHLQPGQFAILVKGGTRPAVQAAELALATLVRPFDHLDGSTALRASAGISAASSDARVGTSLVGRLVQEAAGAAAHAGGEATFGVAFASSEMREEAARAGGTRPARTRPRPGPGGLPARARPLDRSARRR